MAAIFARNALDVNPPVGVHHLVTNGSDWLWAVTALYSFSMLLVVAHAYFARSGERIFHYLFTISLLTGAIAYFTMASDLGSVPVAVSSNLGSPGDRQIFYAKYINWFVGWTPLVIAVGLVSGVSWATIVYNIALTWTWVSTWLSGALVGTTYKWGFYVFGVFAYFLLVASILVNGIPSSSRVGIKTHYMLISGYLSFLWLLYSIAWGLSDGGNKIGVTSGFIFFGIIDVLTVPVLAAAFLFLSTRWDYGEMNLRFTQYGRVAVGGPFPEKEKAVIAPAPAAEPETPAAQDV